MIDELSHSVLFSERELGRGASGQIYEKYYQQKLKQTYQPEGLLTVQLAGQFPAHAPDVGLDGTFRVDLTGSAGLGQEVLIFIGHALVLGD